MKKYNIQNYIRYKNDLAISIKRLPNESKETLLDGPATTVHSLSSIIAGPSKLNLGGKL